MPVNMRTHGHGQGYADLNFLIPELIGSVDIRKGPYFADEGDFSSVGSVHVSLLDSVSKTMASITSGSFGYNRMFGVTSAKVGEGTLLVAGEANTYNGPWDNPDKLRKLNGVMRYSQGTADDGFSLTGDGLCQQMEFHRSGAAARDHLRRDRSLRRARSQRWRQFQPLLAVRPLCAQTDEDGASKANFYVIKSSLNLWNNFTYLPQRSRQWRPVSPA